MKIVTRSRYWIKRSIVSGRVGDKRGYYSSLETSPEIALSKIDTGQLNPGISLVACCMNREENLLKVLDSWLATDADEIVIVDWSSTSELWPQLSQIADPRLKVIRIDGEQHWVAAHALNVGLRFASREMVFRVDCDIALTPNFFKNNFPWPGEFVRGFWKSGHETLGEGKQFINSAFGACKKDLRQSNYYDERILPDGWDDSGLYMRLEYDHGLTGRLINPRSLGHIGQAEEHKLADQAVARNRFLDKFEPTELEDAKKIFYTTLAGNWSSNSPSQDYDISRIEQRYYRGHRVTKSISRNLEIERLAEILAIRQLTVRASSTTPEFAHLAEVDFEFARLLCDAHAVNKSRDLVEGIKTGKGLYFIRCEPGPCRAALLNTLQVMCSHYPSFAQSLILTEGLSVDTPDDKGSILVTSGKLVENLSIQARARELNCIEDLERLLASGDQEAGYLSLSIHSLADEAIRKASQFSASLGGEFASLATPVTGTCLVTSLYDEQILVRLIEYLACVVENLRVFDQVAICYEANNGLLAAVLQELSVELAISPGRLLLLPYQKRPTFEELFSVKTYLPAGTIIAVANADIVFNASFSKVGQVDLLHNIVVLSRRDISSDGSKAHLIHLENGCPNTFSADAWVVRTPFDPDFFLDYPIGTMQCDSFINHQISTSSRYGVMNPCFDINVFHLHDERFNSSDEKAQRDKVAVINNYIAESARNNNSAPVKGVAWCTLASAAIVPDKLRFQQWSPKVLILNFAKGSEPGFGHLLLLHILHDLIRQASDTVIVARLRKSDLDGGLWRLLLRYQAHFSFNGFQLDTDDVEFDEAKASVERMVTRTTSFQKIAELATKNCLKEGLGELLSWTDEAKLLRCELQGDMPDETTLNLINAIRQQESALVNTLFEFFNGLPDYSPEKNLITSFNEKFHIIDLATK